MQKLLSLRSLLGAFIAVAAAAALGMSLADAMSPPQPTPMVKLERVVVQVSRRAEQPLSAPATQPSADRQAC